MNPHPLFVPHEPGVYTKDAFDAWFQHEAKQRKSIRPCVYVRCGLHNDDYERCGCQQRNFMENYMKTQRRVNPQFVAHIVNEMCDASATPEMRAKLVEKMLKHAETIVTA